MNLARGIRNALIAETALFGLLALLTGMGWIGG